MLKHIRLVPLAAESLGVRSMCTYVETSDAKMLLDAGVAKNLKLQTEKPSLFENPKLDFQNQFFTDLKIQS